MIKTDAMNKRIAHLQDKLTSKMNARRELVKLPKSKKQAEEALLKRFKLDIKEKDKIFEAEYNGRLYRNSDKLALLQDVGTLNGLRYE